MKHRVRYRVSINNKSVAGGVERVAGSVDIPGCKNETDAKLKAKALVTARYPEGLATNCFEGKIDAYTVELVD